jgi:hypothetical protein
VPERSERCTIKTLLEKIVHNKKRFSAWLIAKSLSSAGLSGIEDIAEVFH